MTTVLIVLCIVSIACIAALIAGMAGLAIAIHRLVDRVPSATPKAAYDIGHNMLAAYERGAAAVRDGTMQPPRYDAAAQFQQPEPGDETPEIEGDYLSDPQTISEF